MKVCTKCKVEKEVSEFGKHKLGKNGIHPNCKLCRKKISDEYIKKNRKKRREYEKKYREKNIDKLKKYQCEYVKKRKENDFLYKFKHNVRSNIKHAFKRGKNHFTKDAKTEIILGCKIEFFKTYIESLFKKGMTYENHGEWHLDHIIPISSATNEEDVIKLCHYTNYQPLWAFDNFSKGKKIIQKQLKLI